MKKILINALSLDIFISLQNGSLITSFKDKLINNVKIDKYKDTKIYKNIDFDDINQKKIYYASSRFI